MSKPRAPMDPDVPKYGSQGWFDQPPSQAHSQTSLDAALEIAGVAGTLRRRVYDLLLESEAGATDEEMQMILDLGGNTLRPRRIELVTADLVYDSGETRKTKSGRKATVWRARDV